MKTGRMKRVGALLLSFALALSLLPVSARADEEQPIYRLLEDGTLEILQNGFEGAGFDRKAEVKTVRITAGVTNASGGTPFIAGAFLGYSNLTAFIVDGSPACSELDGVLFNADKTRLVCYPAAKPGDVYVIPSSVRMVQASAFADVPADRDLRVYVHTNANLDASSRSVLTVKFGTIPAYQTAVESLTLDQASLALDTSNANKQATLTATVAPADATVTDVLWTSSNEAVATVDQTGKVTAVGAGTATITATTLGVTDGDVRISEECAVTVKVPVTTMTIEGQSSNVENVNIPVDAEPESGETSPTLSVQIDPNATNREIVWTSSDPEIALLQPSSGSALGLSPGVNGGAVLARLLLADGAPAASVTVTAGDDGLASVDVVPRGSGTVTITAAAGDQVKTFTLTLSKWINVGGVTLTPSTLALNVGEAETLDKTLDPEDAESPTVVWTSNHPEIASVDQTGEVTGVASGDAEITVSVTTGSRTETASCAVTVAVPVSGVTLDAHEMTLKLSGADSGNVFGQLNATVTPESATNQTLVWGSSDEAVATVDQNGKVTAIGKGTATITVTADDSTTGTHTDTCAVTVEVLASGVALDQETLTLEEKETASLTATVSPDFTSDKSVTWESSDTDVATVSADGLVTAKSVGVAMVTVTTADGSNQSAACTVTVTPISVKNFLQSPGNITVKVDETGELTASLGPEDAANRTINWTSDDPTVAAVGGVTLENGVSAVTVTGIAAGSALITASSAENPELKASCTVTVPPVPVIALTISHPTLKLRLDPAHEAEESQQINVTIDPAKATNKDVVWTVSGAGADVVSVTPDPNDSAKATVTALKAGRATVIASSAYGNGTNLTATCEVTVEQAPTSVALQSPSLDLKLSPASKTTGTLTALVTPADTTDAITWSSSDASVVRLGTPTNAAADAGKTSTVTATAVGGGTATITVACNGVSDTYTVTVPHLVSGVTLDETSLTLAQGGTATLTPTVTPNDAEDKSVTWSTSDNTVATVDESGLVTAVNGGGATITATTTDGGYTATCEVTVTVAAESITLDRDTLTLRLGTQTAADTGTLSATVAPPNSTSGPVLWSVSSDAVTLSESATAINKITGKTSVNLAAVHAAEDVRITATLGGKTAVCVVTVQQAGGALTVAPGSLELSLTGTDEQRSGTLTATLTPKDATDEIVWESSNTEVATVGTAQGGVTENAKTSTVTVTAVGGGTARITARCGSLVSNVVTVAIPVPVTSVSLDKPALALEIGDTETLSATITPANAAVRTLTWSSSNEAVASVDANGLVTAKSVGTATITVSADGGKNVSTTCDVTVSKISVKEFSQRPENLTVRVKESGTLSAKLGPAGIENKTINWTCGNSAIATLGEASLDAETGVSSVTVTGVSPGSVTITAIADDNHEVVASAVVTVNPIYVSSVGLSKTALTLEKGNSTTLTATLDPTDASNQDVTWLASPAGIVNVAPASATASNGVSTVSVEALAEGRASIIVTTADGNKQAACVVTVPVKVKQLKLNKTELTLGPSESDTLVPTFTPNDAANRTLNWSSSDTSVVTVDANGVVSANPAIVFAAGEAPRIAVISAQTTDGSDLTAQCTVKVQRTAATHVTLDQSTLALDMKNTTGGTLTASVKPDGATIGTVSWSVSDDAVVSLTPNGLTAAVSARKPGSAVVTVTSTDGSYTADCAVTVAPTAVTAVALAPTTLNLSVGGSGAVTAEITPHDATNRAVTWRSTDEDVAVVSGAQSTADAESGTTSITVTAKKAGTATIIATTQDGALTASCTVLVPETAVQSVTLDKSTLTLNLDQNAVNQEQTLTATVNPEGATHKGVTWLSSDESVAKVDQNGKVTAVASGTATITALSVDGIHKAECVVTVKWNVTGVELQKHETTIVKDGTEQLVAAIKPDAVNHTLTWSSSDNTVATVSGSGLVTARKTGSATIKAQVTGGENYDECTVTVVSPTTGIALNKASLDTLAIGDTETLTATVTPADSTDGVTWASSDESVATVENGIVTAVGGGRAEITARSGGFTAACVVTIPTPATGVELNKAALSLGIGDTEPLAAVVQPLTATNRGVTWGSDHEDIATVDEYGVVTAVAVGTASITVTTVDGGFTATCAVTVVPTAVSGVTISGSDLIEGALTLNMTNKTTSSLSATVSPEDATDKSVTWKSGDETVVTVGTPAVENGVSTVTLTAQKPGTAVVTVTTTSGGYRATCLVTVDPTAVTGVSLSGPGQLSVTGTEDEKKGTLTAAVTPDNATNQTLLWSVDKPDVLELSAYETTAESGSSAVTAAAKKAGSATVTVTTQDGGRSATHTITIPATPVTSLSIPETLALTLNDPADSAASGNLTVTIGPENATDKNVTWQSSKPDTVEVAKLNDTTATVTGKKAGTADVTVTCADGVTAVCHVTVTQVSTGITLSPDALDLSLTDNGKLTAELTATVTPAGVSGDVTWSSSDESVVTVGMPTTTPTAEGKTSTVTVSAAGGGTARITASCGGKSASINVSILPRVESVSLDKTTLTLAKNAQTTLASTVLPTGAENKAVTWSSSDESVATVNENGLVTAVGAGSATITVTTADGGKTATCDVTVTVGLTGVTLDSSSLTLKLGGLDSAASAPLTATVTPADATAGPVHWASTDPSIVTVSAGETAINKSDGKASVTLTAQKAGSTTVTATVGSASVVCTVTVEQAATAFYIPGELALVLNSTPEAASQKLLPTITPAGVTDEVTWSSDNVSVATVNANGVVTAVAVGTATVTAACGGKSASCAVTVTALASGVTISPASIALEVGGTAAPTATVLPTNASNPTLTWSSGNTGVATVDENGVVTAVAVGTATVTASTSNGKEASVTVTVSAVTPKDFGTRPQNATIKAGATGQLTASVTPATAAERQITWTSSDPAVVSVTDTVFENGVSTVTLAALKAGSVTITATAEGNNALKATCTVTVPNVPVTGISLNRSALALVIGGMASAASDTLTVAALAGEDGQTPTNTSVNWRSLNQDVATVTDNGNGSATVTAKGAGTATITAAPADGSNVSASCAVTVTVPTSGVTLNTAAGTLTLGSRITETLIAQVQPYPDADQRVEWAITEQTPNSGSGDVVSLVASGASATVTALHPGAAAVRVFVPETGFFADYAATVEQPTTSLSLNETSRALSLTGGTGDDRFGLTATVTPSDTTDALVWTSSDETVAAVTDNGNGTATIIALKGGTARITAKSGSYSAGCTVSIPVPVSSVTLNKETLTLEKGKNAVLSAAVLPSNAADPSIDWASGDENVATVVNGVVTAVAEGSTTITVTARDGSGASASCDVEVVPVAVTGVALNRSTLSMQVGDDAQTLTATVAPDDAANKNVTWGSSNENAATVSNGVVTAVGVGQATVTATTADGGKTASCVVTVWATDAERIDLDHDALTLDLNGDASGTLTATVKPDNTTEKGVLWSVSAPGIVTLSVAETLSGSPVTITAAGAGTVTVTATAKHDGTVKAACTVTVPVPVTGVTLSTGSGASPSAITLDPNETLELHATAAPADAANRSVTISVPDGAPITSTDVSASYGGDGAHLRIVGKQPDSGSAETFTVNATTQDGGKSDSFRITVRPAVTSVSLDKASLDVTAGTSTGLTATVLPAAANQTLTWTSSDESIVTVDSSGNVRAVADGTATITATAKNGTSAACSVTVQTHVTGVEIRSGGAQTISLTLSAVEAAGAHSATLNARVLPADATDQNVTWTVDDPGVLTLSASGGTAVVTGVKAGTAIVTLTAQETGASAQCTVTVERATVAFGKASLVLRFTGSAETQSVALSPVDAGFAIGAPVVNGTEGAASCNTSVYDTVSFTGSADGLVTYTFSRSQDDRYNAVSQTVSVLSLNDVFGSVALENMDARDSVSAALSGTGDVRTIVLTGYTVAKPNTINWAQRVAPTLVSALQGPAASGRVSVSRVNENGLSFIDVLADGVRCYRYQIDFNDVKWVESMTDTSFTASVDIFGANAAAGTASSGTVDVPDGFVDYVLMAGESPEANEELEAEITLNIKKSSAEPAAANVLSLDVTPSYVINHYGKDEEGNRGALTSIEEKGTLSDLDGYQATISVVLNFEPQLIQHIHRDGAGNVLTVEYPNFTKRNNGDGTWTLTWRQSTFSEVNIFAAARSGYVRFVYGAGTADDIERFDERSIGAALPVPAAVDGKTFAGWSVGGVTGKTLTNELLGKIDGSTARAPAVATPVYADETPAENTSAAPSDPVTPVGPGRSGGTATTAKPQEPVRPETLAAEPKAFSDVAEDHWAAADIVYVSARGIFHGVGNGRFAPELTMSRAMIAQMLCNLDGAESADASPFPDTAGTWYDAAAGWAAANGVAVGDGGRFNGDAAVTREQMAVMLYRYAKAKAKAKGYDVSAHASLGAFADAGAVSDRAREAMGWAVAAGLIRGTDRGLEPGGSATRAQVAAIMARFCRSIADNA